MAETQTQTLTLTVTSPPVTSISEMEQMDFEALRSKLKDIKESRSDLVDSSPTSVSDFKNLIQELTSEFQGRVKEVEDSEVASLEPQDFDAFLEQLKKEISSTEEENMEISNEINDLTKRLAGDINLLDGDIESLVFSTSLLDSQGLNVRSYFGDAQESPMDVHEDSNLEILKLQQKIEECENSLRTLQDLDIIFKRIEAIGQISDKLSEVKVLEFEGNCIRLSLKTPSPAGSVILGHKLELLVEPSIVEHELLIEVDKTMEFRRMEIFPCDVPVDDIILTVKSSSHLATVITSSLECLVRQVQHRILLCTLQRLLLKDAKQSRHCFEFSDRDETVTVHLVGGIDAFIKIPKSWPISDSGLRLVSIKNSNIKSNSISLSFLCKIKERANSMNIYTRGHLVRFMDAIEEVLIQETHSELHASGISA